MKDLKGLSAVHMAKGKYIDLGKQKQASIYM